MSSGLETQPAIAHEGVHVVVVTHNDIADLQGCLERLFAEPQNGDLPVTVVDNASLDGTVEMLRKQFPQVHVICNETNLGYGPAVNQGIRSRSSRYVLILNPDVRAHPGAVRSLVGFMNSNPDTVVAGPKLLNRDGSLQLSARRFYTFRTLLFRRTPLGRVFPSKSVERNHLMATWGHEDVRDVDWVLGGCIIVRTGFLEETGGFDERYFLYLEDTDICRTAWEAGHRVQYFPGAVFTHSHTQASRQGVRELRAWGHHLASGVKYYLKWNGGWRKLAVLRCLLLVILDFLVTAGAFWAAWNLRLHVPPFHSSPQPGTETHAALIAPALVLWIASLACTGSYSLKESGRGSVPWARVMLAGVLAGIAATVALVSSSFYQVGFPFSRMILSSTLAFALIGALLCRFLLAMIVRLLWRHGYSRKQCLLLGVDSERARSVGQALRYPSRDFYVAALRKKIADSFGQGNAKGTEPQTDEVIGCREFVLSQHVPVVLSLLKRGVDVVWLEPSGPVSLPFRIRDFYGIPAYRFRAFGLTARLGHLAKGMLDILLAGMALLLASPVLIVLMALVRLEGGPAFFVQERVGRHGRPFRMFKLRTMSAPKALAPSELNNVAEGPLVRVDSDPRVSRIGRFLRRHKLDELPQLLNVLRREMSICGPRPPMPHEVAQYAEWEKLRLEALPGITGLWQVDKDRRWRFDEMVAFDMKYILEWSLAVDLTILAGTIPAMLEGR